MPKAKPRLLSTQTHAQQPATMLQQNDNKSGNIVYITGVSASINLVADELISSTRLINKFTCRPIQRALNTYVVNVLKLERTHALYRERDTDMTYEDMTELNFSTPQP